MLLFTKDVALPQKLPLILKREYYLDFMISRYPVADPSISMSQLTLSSL